jgi:hypothetical protein
VVAIAVDAAGVVGAAAIVAIAEIAATAGNLSSRHSFGVLTSGALFLRPKSFSFWDSPLLEIHSPREFFLAKPAGCVYYPRELAAACNRPISAPYSQSSTLDSCVPAAETFRGLSSLKQQANKLFHPPPLAIYQEVLGQIGSKCTRRPSAQGPEEP